MRKYMRVKSRKAAKFPFVPGILIGEELMGNVFIDHLGWYTCYPELTDIEDGLIKSMVHLKTTHHIEFINLKIK